MADICKIENCDEPVKYVHLQVCSACYSGLALWRGRSMAHKRKRMGQYERLKSRMEHMMDNPKDHPKKMVRRDDLDKGETSLGRATKKRKQKKGGNK